MKSDTMRSSRAILLALVAGTFYTAQEVFATLAKRRPEEVGADVVNGLEFWVIWAVLTPLVLAAARRWPVDMRPLRRPLLAHGAIAVGLATAHNLLLTGLHTLLDMSNGIGLAQALGRANPVAFVMGVSNGVIYYAIVVMVYGVVRYRDLYVAQQLSAAALEAELTRSQLDSLRAQLRPHFLFNTLNAISVFVTEDAAKAREMILRLAALLRRSLDEDAHEVPLEQELAFANDYLEIQRARFGDQLTVRLAVDPAVARARVPVFLLQPLLENAIEHGKSDDGRTTVSLSAGRDDDLLRITVADGGPGLAAGGALHEGIGLSNTRQRLQHLYGSRARVDLGPATGAGGPLGTQVDILVPLRGMPA